VIGNRFVDGAFALGLLRSGSVAEAERALTAISLETWGGTYVAVPYRASLAAAHAQRARRRGQRDVSFLLPVEAGVACLANTDDNRRYLHRAVAKRCGWTLAFVSWTAPDADFAAFTVAIERPGISERRVSLAMDPEQGWIFSQQGEPQAFEDVDRYLGRPPQSRVDPALLARYLLVLGVDLGDTAGVDAPRDGLLFTHQADVADVLASSRE
jgi:hypothetical protein